MLKVYIDPERYGETMAESIAQAMHAERPQTGGAPPYMVAVGPRRLEGDWGKRTEERDALRAREAAIAQDKGWKDKATTA